MKIFEKYPIILQILKFGVTGVINTGVDFLVLNLLIWATNISSGIYYAIFKGISFTVAVINSYFWNKYWTFKNKGGENPAAQFGKFIFVSVIGFGVNVGVASIVVNVVGTKFGISEKLWANVGAIFATGIAMVWNFIGYKFWALKTKNQEIAQSKDQ